MIYAQLAEDFLETWAQFTRNSQQKKISETMQGEIFVLLYTLKQGGRVIPSQISNEMNISSARIAAVLNSLEDKGLITRKIDLTDRRRILVDLTDTGLNLANHYDLELLKLTKSMLKTLGEEDATELVRIFKRLSESISEITWPD